MTYDPEEGFVRDDGGRAAAGFKGSTGDCVERSIAIATQLPYDEVYRELSQRQRAWLERTRRPRAKARRSVRNGTVRQAYEPYLLSLGWEWVPTMTIGSGCKVHLSCDELPSGRLIVRVSKHITTMIDGVIHDTWDPRRPGVENGIIRETRCVYGYWTC